MRVNDGDGKAEHKELEVFVFATSQEVHMLLWDGTNSIPSFFVHGSFDLLCILIKREGSEMLSLLFHCY